MAKGSGTTKSVGSSSVSASRTTTGGGRMNEALSKIQSLSGVKSADAQYNQFSGDVVYSMEYNDGRGPSISQMRMHATADSNGYHRVELPTESNTTVVTATKTILDAIPRSTKMSLEVEVGSREEKAAIRYGFKSDSSPVRDPDTGSYYKVYRRK